MEGNYLLDEGFQKIKLSSLWVVFVDKLCPTKGYIEVLTPATGECDLLRNRPLYM